MFSTIPSLISKSFPVGGGFDPDAQAYLDAVVAAGGTINSTIETATDVLFKDLKTEAIYSELKAMYPVLGSTGPSFAINAIGNSTFDLDFVGSFTFAYNGFNSNSSTAYAATNYVPYTEHPNNAMSLGAFARNLNPAASDDYIMGVFQSQSRFLGWDYFAGNSTDGKYLQNTTTTRVSTPFPIRGFSQLSSDGTTKYYNVNRDGVEYTASAAKDGGDLPEFEIYLSNLNNGGSPYKLQQGVLMFAYMGNYLTPAKMSSFADIVNTFQTTLGRNTY